MAGFHPKYIYYPYQKPEAIGHIMTRKVITLPTTAHVVSQGYHHVPIVDADGRFGHGFPKPTAVYTV